MSSPSLSPSPVPARPGKPVRARGTAGRKLPPLNLEVAKQVGALATPLPWFPPSLEFAEGLYGGEPYPSPKPKRKKFAKSQGAPGEFGQLHKDASIESLRSIVKDSTPQEATDLGNVVDVDVSDDELCSDDASESDISVSHPVIVGMLIDNYVRSAVSPDEGESPPRSNAQDRKPSGRRVARGAPGAPPKAATAVPPAGSPRLRSEFSPRGQLTEPALRAGRPHGALKPVPPAMPPAQARPCGAARPVAPEAKREPMPTLDDLLSPPSQRTAPLPTSRAPLQPHKARSAVLPLSAR
mmetsp:Transcript_26418/g.61556  ORF Transcript_26418/g.61556 Transcript_26418/m.61556 type:complete len:296 (-) Transcript_26418:54-941(-)|eukprot:CAMPEP_0178370016 /NCGR_PEP_ID=MMETSP0689_2-20121128/78_1 /TAXON_ID=160604 /ORGANISM="Amphidinium massartii, Strain CS-259" /LENGTH=295 /DNA_ID=CAMNT_0019989811 /DNA_START=54 /DNA_END=941 /DNA_ORIENTATION=+